MPETFDRIDWYDTPLYYDVVFDEDTRLEGAFLEAASELYGRSNGQRVLEPACGSGRLLAEMASRGWRVTGFDSSKPMLAFARERLDGRGLNGTLFEARMQDFRVRGKFDLAHCLVSTFKYLLSEGDAQAHLQGVARALAPGGIYVVGLHLTQYGYEKRSRERWVGRRGDTLVTCNIQGWPADAATRSERVRSRLVVEEHGETRRHETEWTFRTYDASELKALIARVPELEHVATYDFSYDLAAERELDDSQLDTVLILRRRETTRRSKR